MSELLHWFEILCHEQPIDAEWVSLDRWFNAQISEIEPGYMAWAPDDWEISELMPPEASPSGSQVLLRLGLSESQPLIWLSRTVPPRSAENPIALGLAALYDRSLGPILSPHPLALDFIRAQQAFGLEPSSPSDESALGLAVLQRYLLHRPARCDLELLGFTLAYLYRSPVWWESDVHQGLRQTLRCLCQNLYTETLAQGADRLRIECGFKLYQNAFRALIKAASHTLTAEQALIQVLEEKKRFAKGYHAKVQLGDKSLDAWLAAEPFEGTQLLAHLRASRWISPGNPEQSPLLKLLAFGGPMFGVFSLKEREILSAWIQNPDQVVQKSGPSTVKLQRPAKTLRSRPRDIPSKRALCKSLLAIESTLESPPSASEYLDGLFRKASWMNRLGFARLLPKRYSALELERRLEKAHRKSLERYARQPTRLKKDLPFCRWLIEQWAPAILCDGAWLWSAHAADRHTLDHRLLARTHLEEIGDGALDQNHPHIYRALMRQLDLDLPPVGDPAFADHPALSESAFHLPCLLLAIGFCSQRYWPELIGLNLAIETSGLGEHYRRVIDVLKSLDLNPKIIELHLSIDNLSSGHSRWALESIEALLEDARSLGGESLSEEIWARVRRGYTALTLSSLPILIDTGRYKMMRKLRTHHPARPYAQVLNSENTP